MKKLFLLLMILPIIMSCVSSATNPPLGNHNFPLDEKITSQVEATIDEILVGDNWIAVRTPDTITALDIDTLTRLWSLEFRVAKFEAGSYMVGDTLVIVSAEQIILMTKQMEQQTIPVDDDLTSIVRILGVSTKYLYIVGGPEWTMGVYDLTIGKILWKLTVGRTVGPVFYDSLSNIAYVTGDNFVRAYDNSTGDFLWESKGVYGQGTLYESGVLYIPKLVDAENSFGLVAVDGASQEILWEKNILRPRDIKASSSTILEDLLIFRGDGMIAVDKSSGFVGWTTPNVGEEFYDTPVELASVIYVKGLDSGALYAISADDGTIIGTLRLEDRGRNVVSGHIFVLEDSIIFNTKHQVVIYTTK